MKFKHTAHLAFSLNVQIRNEAGAPVAAYVGRVVYLWLWLPGWLWARFPRTRRQSPPKVARLATTRSSGSSRAWALLFGPGWRDDLALIGRAGWLLVRDWGFYAAI
jgi:hypothetical protein